MKIHYLTFELDLGVKVTGNVAKYPLHNVTYSAIKFVVATSNSLGGDTFTSHGRTDRRRTDFCMKLIYIFFLRKKRG